VYKDGSLKAIMSKLPASIVAVDVETTGFHSDDRIVTLGAWHIDAAHLVADDLNADCLHIIVDPGKKSHPRAEKVHGYSDWTLRHQQPFSDFAETVRSFLSRGEIVVAHNASFDLEFINREYRALGETISTLKCYCTMDGYRQSGFQGRASLNAICHEMGLNRIGDKHGALEDSWLALMIYFKLHHVPAKYILPFARIVSERIPLVPYNFREPPPLPEGPVPSRRAAIAAQFRQLTAIRTAAKETLTKAVRPTAILLLEVARASESLVEEEVDILVALIRATRDRLGLQSDDEIEREILAELLDINITQNQLTRSARALCADSAARYDFPKWLATMATIDGSVSESERSAIDRVKAAIKRVLSQVEHSD
jgi:DNA polymerase-3 subunit epsilon